MKAFTKGHSGGAIAWAAMVAFTTVITFSIVPAAFAEDPSPEEIARITAAAEKGEVWAQYNLGILYENGEGVPENDATAVKWYRKAAEQGIANAQYNLDVMYHSGRGVPEDDATAVKWYTKAAEQGDANAQSNLLYPATIDATITGSA